ncbi:WD40 repeat-like protein [Auriscalpium vulgare]|uniref:WD40 repeat-like protein n=1 Tax=Auriscalpium vulgare TaxID=40419 RepID=A0ACB8RT41_9AGAM|nr:WD40 repeat-like protein [Auriscalpium vulgare]
MSSLLQSPTLAETSHPLHSVQLPSDAYVLHLASLPLHYAAAASAPTHHIHLYDKISFQSTLVFPGHEGGTTSLRAVDALAGTSRSLLLSSGRDSTVQVWDERTGAVGVKMLQSSSASRALLSCDVSPDGFTVAAGSELKGDEAQILFWDPRNPNAPLRVHSSTHSEDITIVEFSPPSNPSSSHNVLLSASSDGLISLSNAEEDDEDEAVMQVGNWGCSISQAGWIPRTNAEPRVWAASDMETFSAWSEELDLLSDLDIRSPSVHNQNRTWVTDYLIDCHAACQSGLSVFTGSNEGDVALLRNANYFDRASPWQLERLWIGGHSGVVRTILWDEQASIVLSGGEDSKLHAWTCPQLPGDADRGLAAASPYTRKRDHGDDDDDVEMGEIYFDNV